MDPVFRITRLGWTLSHYLLNIPKGSSCMFNSKVNGYLTQKLQLQGEEGMGGIHAESNMETYVTICKTDKQWEFAL